MVKTGRGPGSSSSPHRIPRKTTTARSATSSSNRLRARSPSSTPPDEVADFLREEGIPPPELKLPDGTAPGDAYVVLAALWRFGSEGRRLFRRFVGRWVDERPPSRPETEVRIPLVQARGPQGPAGARGRVVV